MKLYKVTQVYNGTRDFQNIRADSREEAIKIAKVMPMPVMQLLRMRRRRSWKQSFPPGARR